MVRSEELRNTERPPQRQSRQRSPGGFNGPYLAAGLVGVVIGGVAWLVGARFTVDGAVWLANWLLAFLQVPWRVPTPLSWQLYAVLCWLPVLYSVIEWRCPPVARREGRTDWAPAEVTWTWLTAVAMDMTTTFLGLPIENLPVAGAATFFFTFWPEWMIRASIRRIRKAVT